MIMISQDCHVKSIGEEVHVLFFDKIDAKNIKNKLEENGFLNKEFRMTTCSSNELYIGCIAAPLVLDVDESIINSLFLETNVIRGFGIQFCPYSTSSLGNHTTVRSLTRKQTPSDKASITLVQSGIMKAFSEFLNQNKIVVNISRNISDILIEIEENLLELNQISCPKTLQYLGDDKTLILPLKSFDIERDVAVGSFISSSLQKCMTDSDHKNCVEFVNCYLWKSLAYTFSSSRVVRRGEINPNSKIRLSEYKILWFSIDNTNNYYNPKITTGPGSPGWITVTEQGVRQSFDLTKVMFSRGNITEKIRFGKLVQPGETVLDLYAGIGYFTLPALLHGGAECVYACEWNEEAVKALLFNLEDNGVHHRATVLVGDCRKVAVENNLVNMFDRISLGLLPSSEGGWRTAVKALRRATGGWLHIHGNVPFREVDQWVMWMCYQLYSFIEEDELISNQNEWCVIASHVEKVKSFAPTVNHYVADVFVGPFRCLSPHLLSCIQRTCPNICPGSIASIQTNETFRICNVEVNPPSCALAATGVLHQEWMR